MPRSLYFTEPRAVEVHERERRDPEEGEVRVGVERSAVSPGTELLVYRGEVPTEMAADATIDALADTFEFPLRYGYAAVGRVEAVGPSVDSAWLDRRVFGFNPHESHFCAPVEDVLAVPEDCSATEATYLPNVETAVNLVQDGAPRLGERAVVFGQGVVGLLTTALLGRFPLAELVTLDRYPDRRELARELGADAALDPEGDAGERLRDRLGTAGEPEECCDPDDGDVAGADLTYELSGCPDALDSAIAATGYDGRVVVGSWYGTKPTELDLGGRFHRSRVSVESSQVSTISPDLRGRWSKERRLDVAWNRLCEVDVERFVTHEFDIEDAAAAYELLDERPDEALGVVFEY
ncbi:zinc-binding alcohol dehydrogenase [Halorussus gelatinilyticus]|uniref:Zinc-binding alcohol dehydrogenase n=1 Tax=Halorussus gelatinilyticus TaxID=2937524 RepID=A0A8U0ID93_9EURY|nr:zinc-binding alcohol dehydrogenase [Halorussus gelatinilyticus]UPV98877.1 zinc-binding alcohol dehydrogenase [Halorussus gelatinilyticus]